MFRGALIAALLAAAGLAPLADADTLLMEGLQQSVQSSDTRPRRGMTMDKVQATWGMPAAKGGAVGDPPISRWEYADFIVYFEYARVIHAVRK